MLTSYIFLSVIDEPSDKLKFLSLYNLYENKIFSIALSITKDFHDAEDASQNALFALARNIQKINLEDTNKAKIYIYKTAKCAAYDIVRKKEHTIKVSNIDDANGIISIDDISKKVESSEACENIVSIISSLPEIYRDVLTMYFVGNFKVSEISDMLFISIPTVKSRIRRGKSILQNKIKELKIYEEL